MKEKPEQKSYLNWVDGPVLGNGPPRPLGELLADKEAIHKEIQAERKRRTQRVRKT